MMIKDSAAEKVAAKMLARYGIVFIWDTYIAAAAAYGLGNLSIAAELIEIAEAAEREWMLRNAMASGAAR